MNFNNDIGKDIFENFFNPSRVIGFDDVTKRIRNFNENIAKTIPGYPPYNVKKVDENKYVIELAVAGFGKSDIEITIEDGVLKISGSTKTDDSTNYLYKGIAERAFTRTFSLADTVEVKNADLINGMLKIWLNNVIPESKKPRKVDINGESKPEFLNE